MSARGRFVEKVESIDLVDFFSGEGERASDADAGVLVIHLRFQWSALTKSTCSGNYGVNRRCRSYLSILKRL